MCLFVKGIFVCERHRFRVHALVCASWVPSVLCMSNVSMSSCCICVVHCFQGTGHRQVSVARAATKRACTTECVGGCRPKETVAYSLLLSL